jgi:sugar O-acyltransferase (sialic acid O-acetyltransferase NeuD family)
MTDTPILIIGAGGHSAVVLDAALAAGYSVLGLTDRDPGLHGTKILGVPVIGDDDAILEMDVSRVRLLCGIGSVGDTALRRHAYDRFKQLKYGFATVLHPGAIVASSAELKPGAVVMAGAIVQPRCRVGENVIVNTGAQLDHDCMIGAHSHVAPGAILCGNVKVGDGTHVGAGSVVKHGMTIGAASVIGVGAVVIRDVADGRIMVGNPAKEESS